MKQLLFGLLLSLSLLIMPATAFAAGCPQKAGDSKTEILKGINQTGNGCDDSKITNSINVIVQLLSWVAGVIAVIMIIVAGVRFMTSGGDAGKVASARSALIYAAIGLAVAASAQLVIQFVLSTSANF